MSEINDFVTDPVYLDRFQTYCLMKDGTIVTSADDLITRQSELEPYISSFIVECPKISDAKAAEKNIISSTHRRAIRVSLENSIYGRRKSYEDTFASSIFYRQDQCARILQDIENEAHSKGKPDVLGSNPLVGILGLGNDPNHRWSSLIRGQEHEPGKFIVGTFLDQDIDINMYHPYVWHLLDKRSYYELQAFVRNTKARESFLYYLTVQREKKRTNYKK